jgi:Tfp pilus assembly protein PilO
VNRRGPIIAGAIAGVLALLAVLVLVLPKMKEVSTTKVDLQNAVDEEVTLQAQVKALQDAQAAAPETEQEIKGLEAKVPPTPDLPGLFRLLQSTADVSGVDFFTFSPGAPTPDPSGGFSVISSSMVVTGGYFALDEFLYNLENLPRAAKVMSVSISAGAAASSTSTTTSSSSRLQMQLTVEFYTTDASAGPGSTPGSSTSAPTVPGA